ncbi:MAG TPA: C25 family cysteine peptidase [Chitinophagaceae bacterium]
MKKNLFLFFIMLFFLSNSNSQVRQLIKKKEPASEQQVQQMPQEPVKQTVAQTFNKIELLSNPTEFLVLGKRMFESTIQRFIDHKMQRGVSAAFVDIESLKSYPGKDEPEKIKRAIADAYTLKGVRYVMLVGDASLFPVRHKYVSTGNELGRPANGDSWFDGGYNPTDFYYANLFHHNPDNSPAGFDDWDADGDGKYNEQVWQFQGTGDDQAMNVVTYNPDNVDGYPDIALGRVPVHTVPELDIFINKVIKYETGIVAKHGGITFAAGSSYPNSTQLANEILAYNNSYFQNFTGTGNIYRGVYNSKTPAPAPWEDANFATLRNSILKSWALIYVGHGYNLGWDIQDDVGVFYDDKNQPHALNVPQQNFDYSEVEKMQNKIDLPVVFSIGCETGQFKPDVPKRGEYIDIYGNKKWYRKENGKVWEQYTKEYYNNSSPLTISPPSPYDLDYVSNRTFACSWLLNKNEAGAIAFFGETVICENYHGRDLIERVLNTYPLAKPRLGDMWLEGQRQFWRDFKNSTNVFQNPRAYLSIMTFFGDPTLLVERK